MRCGLLGQRLGHSYSPQIHSLLTDYAYDLFEIDPTQLEFFLKTEEFHGINVTIPYKKAVIPFLDELSPVAQKLGAVNTIVRRPDGSLMGHNTDYFGFQSMVQQSGLNPKGKKVLVLGSGGASNTAVAVMEALGAKPVVISRSGENHYGNLQLHADAAIIVNTTPVGMYPDTGLSPIDLDLFPQLEGVLDVVYNPARTQLLLDAHNRGLITMNGLWMLVAQAKESAEWFTGKPISDENIGAIHHQLRLQMKNIILIGMPGCGKSTIGQILSQKTGRTCVDADTVIATKAGMSIPEIFEKSGEDAFRRLETQVLAELGKQSGLIIATGGGCVTRPENYPLLHQNGTIIWLKRDINQLPTAGRPLSQGTNLEEMFRIRRPLYTEFADFSVENDGVPEDITDRILNILEEQS
ncbi:MAG: shikimate kinase [Oscillospiraceae bacterium]|nr:shikimate kinase [Oscillospiraceae bacterium]